MNIAEVTWGIGRLTLVPAAYVATRLHHYGKDRVPDWGGVVLAMNHFSWIDVAAFGAASPRTIYYVAKVEAHRVAGLGQLIRGFGTLSVRRGESDREAVRLMRQTVRDGRALGVFVEGTRQLSGVPGEVQAGAAMVAITEGVPVIPGAIHGTQTWRPGNFHAASIAWGEPMRFDGLARNGRGYREGSEQIKTKIHELWQWLVELHEVGRPRVATPPR